MAYYKLIIIISFCMKFSRYILINISFLWMFHFSLPRFMRYAHFRSLDSCFRGDNEIRTRDPLLARQVLSQLSYTPGYNFDDARHFVAIKVVGWSGLEPPTSRLSGVCSNLLSYQPSSPQITSLFRFRTNPKSFTASCLFLFPQSKLCGSPENLFGSQRHFQTSSRCLKNK